MYITHFQMENYPVKIGYITALPSFSAIWPICYYGVPHHASKDSLVYLRGLDRTPFPNGAIRVSSPSSAQGGKIWDRIDGPLANPVLGQDHIHVLHQFPIYDLGIDLGGLYTGVAQHLAYGFYGHAVGQGHSGGEGMPR